MKFEKVEPRQRRLIADVALIYAAIVAACGIGMRFHVAANAPIWIDESWTAVISSLPTGASWLHAVLHDPSAPLYYAFIWAWPFESDFGLRLPSLAFLIATAALPHLYRIPHSTMKQRAITSLLILLWDPGISLFVDARPYALLLLVCTAEAIAFARLMDKFRRPWIWISLASLAVLTHYYAAAIVACQTIAVIARYRGEALRAAPWLLITVPAFTWIAFHLPALLVYARPDVAWYLPVPASAIPLLLVWPLSGSMWIGWAMVVALLACHRRAPLPIGTLAGSGIAALLLLLALGFFRPSLTDRYLLVVVPSLLLSIPMLVSENGLIVVAAMFAFASTIQLRQVSHALTERGWDGVELPARYINAKVVALRVDPRSDPVVDPDTMRRIIEDGFRRSGKIVQGRWRDGADATALISLHGPVAGWRCHKVGRSTAICSR